MVYSRCYRWIVVRPDSFCLSIPYSCPWAWVSRDVFAQAFDKPGLFITSTSFNVDRSTEPVYILDTNLGYGSCERDSRGPPRNKVCLPERPNRVYWLYSMVEAKREVASPPGLKRLLDNADGFSNITKEDIVRSSLWVAENKLEKVIRPYNVTTVPGGGLQFSEKASQSSKHAGSLPGAFTIPVCRNPAGEAISSVWSDDSKNFPCRCG
jgi:hypothetical protein